MSEDDRSASPAYVSEAAPPPLAAFAGVLRERGAAKRLRADPKAFFAERYGLSERDLDSLSGLDPARLLVYRDMVHSRLRRVIRDWLPRTLRRVSKSTFRSAFVAFMDERAPRTRYFRCVPAEFAEFAAPRWRAAPDVPDYVVELMRHEILLEDLRSAPLGGEPVTGNPMALDRPMRVDGTAHVLRYAHAVHELPKDPEDETVPARRDCQLLVYRDRASHRVRLIDLTDRAAAVVERLIAGESVQAALTGACAQLGQALDDEFLAAMVPFLADLEDREVLLGAEP